MADMDLFVASSVAHSTGDHVQAGNTAQWRLFTDRVMGGVSSGTLGADHVAGRDCLRMRGEVSLENNGGFVQMAANMDPRLRARLPEFAGLSLEVFGTGERYNVHLRTEGMMHPWQSYRSSFIADPAWRTITLPFDQFEPYRTERPLDVSRIRRVGLVAIGRRFTADLCVAKASLYAE